jgi:hypothetical protein
MARFASAALVTSLIAYAVLASWILPALEELRVPDTTSHPMGLVILWPMLWMGVIGLTSIGGAVNVWIAALPKRPKPAVLVGFGIVGVALSLFPAYRYGSLLGAQSRQMLTDGGPAAWPWLVLIHAPTIAGVFFAAVSVIFCAKHIGWPNR